MTPGAILVDDVSRHFRVHGREARTLKDLFVQRGRTEPQDVLALRGVTVAIEPGEAVDSERVISTVADDPDGLDINAQICFFPDGSGRFIAGEDTGQPTPPAGAPSRWC